LPVKSLPRILLILLFGLSACSTGSVRSAIFPASTSASPQPANDVETGLASSTLLPSASAALADHETPAPAASLSALPLLEPSLTAEPFRLPAPPEKRTHYQLQATLDYPGHTLAVDERITYTNITPDSLSSIVLIVEAYRFPGSFQLTNLTDENGIRLTQHRLKDTSLTINLPQPLAPGKSTELALTYTLRLLDTQKLPALRPYPLGYTSIQTNLGDWYPFVPPYLPETGWVVHPPTTFGEHLVYDIADFNVAIRFTAGQNNLVLAASSPAVQDGEWQRFSHLAARNFAWSVSPYYQVITQEVRLDENRSTLVASYFFAAHAEAGKSLLDTMVRALQLYSRLWGAYPRPMLTGVQADFLDGMEYDGLYFLSTDFYNWHKDNPEDFLTALAAHETAHQWWGGIVGSDQALQPWLDEALCTYSEVLYYENTSPPALNWWWAYRVNYYDPQGRVDISIYDTPNVAGQYLLYRNPVYLRGAQFLDELRQTIGDAAFFASLREYAARYAYRQADSVGFLEILQQHTIYDLEPILKRYFTKPE
jgi:hypothetical protein